MSMVTSIYEQWSLHDQRHPKKVYILYSTKVNKKLVHSNNILFLDRLKNYEEHHPERLSVTLFITGDYEKLEDPEGLPWHFTRRLNKADILAVLGDLGKRQRTVCYICGPPSMTDDLVHFLSGLDGLEASRVLCEKWW
jgi:NAD(P)H-flavin reductase